jgi:hypothetical protein
MADTAFTESPWFFGLLGPLGVILIAVVYARTRAAMIRSGLPRLFANRTQPAAFDTCRAALPDVDPVRVRQAYRWVQQLVPYPDPPIQAYDDLGSDLYVGRRGMLYRLSEAAMRKNPTQSHTQSPLYSVHTVAELMAEVLRHGYEAQVYDPAAEPVVWH